MHATIELRNDLLVAVLAGRDVIGVVPAGTHSAIRYVLRALSLSRPTIVVTRRATAPEDKLAHLDRGPFAPRVYVTPEQLQSNDCIELLRRNGTSRIIVDESPDLRPAYLGIAAVAWRVGRPPILALVCAEASISDAIMLLGLRGPAICRVERPGGRP